MRFIIALVISMFIFTGCGIIEDIGSEFQGPLNQGGSQHDEGEGSDS
jgi:hypothetical protein